MPSPRSLINDLRIDGQKDILPTYRVRRGRGSRNGSYGRGWDRTSDPSRVKRVLSR